MLTVPSPTLLITLSALLFLSRSHVVLPRRSIHSVAGTAVVELSLMRRTNSRTLSLRKGKDGTEKDQNQGYSRHGRKLRMVLSKACVDKLAP